MTENSIVGESRTEHFVEYIDIIDAFADKGPLAEQILINIGNRSRIGVDSPLIGVHPGIQGTVHSGKTHCYPRLQHAIAADDALFFLIITGMIQRMRHGFDKLSGRFTRQLRIRIERNDVFDPGKHRGTPCNQFKTTVRFPAQQPVQVRQFAAFAFISHPDSFLRIPEARTVKQKKTVIMRIGIFTVEFFNLGTGEIQQRLIFGKLLRRSVTEIGQQSKVKIVVTVCQKCDLQRPDQLFYSRLVVQNSRHHDH